MPERTVDIQGELQKGVDLLALRGEMNPVRYRLDAVLRHFRMSLFNYDIESDLLYIRKTDMRLEGFTDFWCEEIGEYYVLKDVSRKFRQIIRPSMVVFATMKLKEVSENASGAYISFEIPIVYEKGNSRWVNIIADTLPDKEGKPVWVMGYCRDVQEQVKEMDRLQKIAQTDLLTGFRNRNAGMKKIGEWLREEQNTQHYVAVVDLDKFKTANDMFGHTFGDIILREAAECMQETIGRRTVYCRTGGDEFLLFGACENSGQAIELLDTLRKKLCRTVNYNNANFNVSASIGVSIHPMHGSSFDELYDKADMAMYHAKKNGLDKPALYDDTMDAIDIRMR